MMKFIASFAIVPFLIFLPMMIVRGQETTIYACVKNNGAMRIIDASTSCGANEQSLSWNVQGPAGAQGQKAISANQGRRDHKDPRAIGVIVGRKAILAQWDRRANAVSRDRPA